MALFDAHAPHARLSAGECPPGVDSRYGDALHSGQPHHLHGTGDICTTFARKAKLLGAGPITGVNRSGRADGSVYDRVLPIARLDEILPETHVLVMALPGTPETVGTLSRGTHCPSAVGCTGFKCRPGVPPWIKRR